MAVQSLTPQELAIWRAFQDMGEEVRGRVGRDISEATGLSGPEFGVLSPASCRIRQRRNAPTGTRRGDEMGKSRLLAMEDRRLIKRKTASTVLLSSG